MIIYNVTYSIDPEVHEDWLAWMKGNYIPEVISYGNLSQVNLNQVISEEDSFITYAAQYVFSSMKDFSYFQKEFYELFHNKHAERYQDRVVSFSTLLKQIDIV